MHNIEIMDLLQGSFEEEISLYQGGIIWPQIGLYVMHLANSLNFTLSSTQLYFLNRFSCFQFFWLYIMCNLIGGQLDEHLNAFLATCHVVIYMHYVITCDSCGK